MPNYQREDYRDAIQLALALHNKYGGDVVIASDPVAPGYYGLQVVGSRPCPPFRGACEDALNEVPWKGGVRAIEGQDWSRESIERWLAVERRDARPVVALIQSNRSSQALAWQPAMLDQPAVQFTAIHGFNIAVVPPADQSKAGRGARQVQPAAVAR
jgi:hypothetical protein